MPPADAGGERIGVCACVQAQNLPMIAAAAAVAACSGGSDNTLVAARGGGGGDVSHGDRHPTARSRGSIDGRYERAGHCAGPFLLPVCAPSVETVHAVGD